MLAISHVLVGAAVGKRVANPIVAFLVGILSHLIIDKVPHFWPKAIKKQDLQMYLDGFGVIVLFSIFLFWPLSNKMNIFWGAFGGAFVDIVLVIGPKLFPKFSNNPVRVWHEKRQYHFHNPVYLLTDFTLSIIGLVLILV